MWRGSAITAGWRRIGWRRIGWRRIRAGQCALVLLGAASAVFALAHHGSARAMSPVGKVCYERATTNAQLLACAGAEYQRQGQALGRLVGRIRGEVLESKRLPAFDAALKRWREWRDAECAVRADMVRSGSAAPRVRLQCLADLIERQVLLLKEAVE